jgi:RimJ/RimL family protein N-acetyltransferase
VELRTRRLVLRPVAIEDAEAIRAYRGDAAVAAYLPHSPLDAAQARQFMERAVSLWSSEGEERFDLRFAVVAEGAVIGDVHAWNTAESLQPASADPTEVWIGYAFNPRHHGRGYASEAVEALVDRVFTRGAQTVFANCYVDNTSSITLLERLGFEEHVRYTAEEDACGKNAPSVRLRLRRPKGANQSGTGGVHKA